MSALPPGDADPTDAGQSDAGQTDDEDAIDASSSGDASIEIVLGPEAFGARLDRAIADAVDPSLGFSRSRLRALIEEGALSGEDGRPWRDPSQKVKSAAVLSLAPPPPRAATPLPEAIPLEVVFEDDALLVVNKPAGMAVHPAPGSETGTLVNAVLAHCGDSLSGVGGELRPGIVHRIDKETSGLLVVAKCDAAHQGLAAQFAEHSIARVYHALAWGAPDRADPRLMGLRGLSFAPLQDEPEGAVWGRIETEIARSRTDRKKMAAVFSGGKRAVTWFQVADRYGGGARGPAACRLECRLETGRTHQIRVHMAYAGHGLLGDPLYGRASASRFRALPEAAQEMFQSFTRQALHAGALGFEHPLSGEKLTFEASPPEDFQKIQGILQSL